MSESRDEYVYGHVLDALSGGLYPNKLDVIREYLQNSYDAIREYIRQSDSEEEKERKKSECKVIISIKGGSLFIYDNATGMDFQTLNEYRKIGFSRRPFGEFAGWRGIGKAAGLSVVEKLIVTTCQGKGVTYQLTFDANEMIGEVHSLRSGGENIPFNELIEKYSSIKTIKEGDEHYTSVELHKIKSDAVELLNHDRLKSHLSTIAPVPFNPDFKYKSEIEEQLEIAIEDYISINLYLEDDIIYKPYKSEWVEVEGEVITKIDEPQYMPIYDKEGENLIAICWYCMHSERGQIKTKINISGVPVNVGGLLYRSHDIRIGDAYLTRKTLWRTTPERSLWALGEIHILGESVEPTSDRNDFIDNHSRYLLYEQCRVIAQEISRRAGKLSDQSRAREKITEADNRIKDISAEVASKTVPKPLVPSYIYEATALKKEAEKRKPKTPEEELKIIADNVIKTADEIVKQLTDSLTNLTADAKVYSDITEELKISEEGRLVYEAIIEALQNYFANEPRTFEEIIRRIRKSLEDAFSS